MDEYIKRKDLLKAFPKAEADVFENCRNCTCLDSEQIEDIIKSIPAADVVERKRGKWQIVEKHTEYRTERCSICGFVANRTYIRDIWNFCPNCGADDRKSRGEEG